MGNQFLNYLGKAHSDFIHAKGKLASNKLIELLGPKSKENILEVGFGTGATLVRLAALHKTANFFGFELSELMFHKAVERIRFCGLSDKVQLVLLTDRNKFPATDNTFDKVYCESIIAIQEGDDFKNLFLEIQRVLKPNGMLVFNETIWLEKTERETAQSMNSTCKQLFGIIQSNDEYLHIQDWKNLLFEIGFEVQVEISLLETNETKTFKLLPLPLFLSKLYTLKGKMKAVFTTEMRKEWKDYKRKISSLNNHAGALMQGFIIKSVNRK